MFRRWIGLLILVPFLGACATVPTGPSVMVLPGGGKSFEQFQADDAICRQWAYQQTGTTPGQAASNRGGAKNDQELAAIRRKEFAAACEILKVNRGIVLDYPDGQLHRQESGISTKDFITADAWLGKPKPRAAVVQRSACAEPRACAATRTSRNSDWPNTNSRSRATDNSRRVSGKLAG